MSARPTLAAWALLLLVGCTAHDSTYCDLASPCTDAARLFCDVDGLYGASNTCQPSTNPDGGAPLCLADLDCEAGTPICQKASGACRTCSSHPECIARNGETRFCVAGRCKSCLEHADCAPAVPICDQNLCRGCRQDTECSSRVCELSSGSCMDEANIIYVGVTGCVSAAMGGGTRTRPLCSLGEAQSLLDANHTAIHIGLGHYNTNLVFDHGTVLVVGEGAPVLGAGNSGPVLLVKDTAHAFLRGVSFQTCSNQGPCIRCGETPGNPLLTLSQTTISGYFLLAVEATHCDFTLEDSVISGSGSSVNPLGASDSTVTLLRNRILDVSGGIGIMKSSVLLADNEISRNSSAMNLSSCTATVSHNLLRDNVFGVIIGSSRITFDRNQVLGTVHTGIQISDSNFTITNNIVANNGNDTDAYGTPGLSISARLASADTEIVANNTIANNRTPPGTGSGGIVCTFPVGMVNSIVWGNSSDSNCLLRYSDLASNPAGTGNFSMNPQFLDESNRNYHLAPSSPCRDRGTSDMAPDHDIDGDRRPPGTAVDTGADELP